jgi:fumarylacetoacetase
MDVVGQGPHSVTSTWLPIADDDPFGIRNLPYGTARWPDGRHGLAVRIGDHVLDVGALGRYPTLDALLRAGRAQWREFRAEVTHWLSDDEHRDRVEPQLYPLDAVRMLLPFTVADYVDFYASAHHATNVGRLFRPDGDPLTPNWKHLPIGYHGRSGTVVVSGTDVVRPCGQLLDGDQPVHAPTQRLDFEAEVAFVVGTPSVHGVPVAIGDFREHVFGVVLLNDWSARDIQAWEYVPLGPFLGKSFATSIAAWVTPLDALDAAWTAPPPRDRPLLPYLRDDGTSSLDLQLTVAVDGAVLSEPPFAAMYWTPAQLLAHLTVNGASVRSGDLFASGTVSGPRPDQLGCLLELTRNGSEPVVLPDGRSLAFLADGQEVVLSASAPALGGGRIALGEVRGRIAAAAGRIHSEGPEVPAARSETG